MWTFRFSTGIYFVHVVSHQMLGPSLSGYFACQHVCLQIDSSGFKTPVPSLLKTFCSVYMVILVLVFHSLSLSLLFGNPHACG